jgi:TIR domain
MADDAKITGEKLKVFISYSRRDAADFADELVAGLELAGFAPYIDRHDIKSGEPWEQHRTHLGRHVGDARPWRHPVRARLR